jgi:hypothetical protein
LLCLDAYGETAGQPCEQLDRPVPGQPYGYIGWRCQDLLLPTIAGTDYQVRLRWNRAGLASRASVVWLAGGNGSEPYSRIDTGLGAPGETLPLRVRLDQEAQIRSIEPQFINPADGDDTGGYWAAPRQGYLKAAIAYQQILNYLQQSDVDLLQGRWLTQVGSSNGATLIAFTLAYLEAGAYSPRVILISGPFTVDILRECRDPGFIAYSGDDTVTAIRRVTGSEIRRLLSIWNGWPDCASQWFIDWRRSLFGFLAEQSFPNTEVEIVMGADDEFGPWILNSNELWYDAIDARSKRRTVIAGIDHDLFGKSAATEALLFDLISREPHTD